MKIDKRNVMRDIYNSQKFLFSEANKILMKLFGKNEPHTVEVKGNVLHCPVYNHDHFWTRNAQLNTAIASFFNLDWTNRSATCFVCAECAHISWFLGN